MSTVGDSMQASLEALAALDLAKMDSENCEPPLSAERTPTTGSGSSTAGGPSPSEPASGQPKAKAGLSYTSKELRRMRDSKVARRWPDFLELDFKNQRGQWDPDRWHQGRRRGSTPPPGEARDEARSEGADAKHVSLKDRPSS